jgi:hypothetical protein
MSRHYFLLVFFFLFLINVNAQFADNPVFYAKGGLAASTIQNSQGSGFNKINIMAGLGYFKPLEEEWGMMIELNIAQKGTRKVADGPSAMVNQYRADLWYLQLAGLCNYQISEDVSVFLGPTLGYLVASSEEDFNGAVPENQATNYKDFELSVLLGFKYHITKYLATGLYLDQSILPIVDTGLENNSISGIRQFSTVTGLAVYVAF